ncbi:MAG: thiamine diphosphokinase [Ruminococcus sp.]|nr:thiamine diphosphokinase [Ruminococcus sp.]
MKSCVIFTGGKPEPRIPDGLDLTDAFVIAADRGYKNCRKLGILPDLAIGDFDSLGYAPNECEQLTFPKKKDDTDLMLAVKEALERGYNDITITGAMGGRFDHLFANVQVLAYIREQGAWGRIFTCYEQIMLVTPGSYRIPKKEKYSLSLFAYSAEVKGLTIEGTEYPLEDGIVTSSFPIGISNVIIEDDALISFDEGLLLIVQSRI